VGKTCSSNPQVGDCNDDQRGFSRGHLKFSANNAFDANAGYKFEVVRLEMGKSKLTSQSWTVNKQLCKKDKVIPLDWR